MQQSELATTQHNALIFIYLSLYFLSMNQKIEKYFNKNI